MRTTVTLDSDVERLLKDQAHRTRRSFKATLNETIRHALRPASGCSPKLLPARNLGLRPGIDPRRLNQLADDVDAETFNAAGRGGRA
jgi:hypothetical protein